MTKQAERVEKAIEMIHDRPYRNMHDKVLHLEEEKDAITITVNPTELEILASMVSERIGKEHSTWFDITHDNVITINDMAYELAGSVLREDRLQRLFGKLTEKS